MAQERSTKTAVNNIYNEKIPPKWDPIVVGVSGTIWNRIRAELIAMAEIVERSRNQCLLISK